MAEKVQDRRDTDRLYRPGRWDAQDVGSDRPGSGLDGLAPAPARPDTEGLASANGVVVYKMSGSGNDFVFLDGRTTPLAFVTPERIREICDRRTGVGGDGLCLLEPGERSDTVRLHYFNRDGLRAEMCGNASLCAARLASWVEVGTPDGVILHTDAGFIPARRLDGPGERAEIAIGEVRGIIPAPIERLPGELSAHFLRVGVPH